MSTQWLFTHEPNPTVKARATSQALEVSQLVLALRNPWVTDSVFMGKIYTAMTLAMMFTIYPDIFDPSYRTNVLTDTNGLAFYLFLPLIFTPFLAYRIFFIRGLSHVYLNRATQEIYYKRFSTLITFEWPNTIGGVFRRTEFGGSSFSTSYALAFAPRRKDGTLHQKDCLWVDSNEPTDPDIQYVAEVWEYLRHFMDHGPDKLPPPGEPNWWHRPLHAICLTPAEAWRHYAPWRTGEPGEMQGKKNWQLPFWAVLFPYNFSLAICWYVICRVFNVRAAPPPPEAFEEAPIKQSKRKRP
ncbi:hypothetical protein E6B08_11025 [Pseudomonas putida]|uniref:Transmembrane protein n=1 Tax=Pseudomonas putida TaxID=303 RepID=A0A4D6X779_PSEPU|nr:hypothetical protein [Pseudomonas putida]QCI11859.1 hypothetical protein E6B08_11025 [Pseudomonas putida]